MTETELKYYCIQPCCIDTYLPKAVQLAPRRALTFFTNGDVSMEKFYRAVSHLVDDPHVMVLTMPSINNATAAFLCQCFERKWITDLVLSTNRSVSELIDTYLSDYKSHILYAQDRNVTESASHLVLYSNRQSLSITGPMWDVMSKPHLMLYTMLYQPRYDVQSAQPCCNPVFNAVLPDMMRHRKHQRHIDNYSWRLRDFLTNTLPPYKE